MAKCEKCGQEYPDDTEHTCSEKESQEGEVQDKSDEAP